MKIEPRKIKKTLKYAAAGACIATSLATVGCNDIKPETVGNIPVTVTQTPEEVYLDGDIATTPMPTIQNLPDKGTPEPDELQLAGDIAFTEATPELAGGIPAPDCSKAEN